MTAPALTVLVCRGCCCGTERKHPEYDHAAALTTLTAAAEKVGAQVRITDCLGPCGRSNVIVLRARTPADTTTVWLGGVLGPQASADLAAWIAADTRDLGALARFTFAPDTEANDGLAKCLAEAGPHGPNGK